jgi:hypothetical protein
MILVIVAMIVAVIVAVVVMIAMGVPLMALTMAFAFALAPTCTMSFGLVSCGKVEPGSATAVLATAK